MVLSDTLSRLPNPENAREIPLDLRVDGVEYDDAEYLDIDALNFSPQRLENIREETQKSPVLHHLKEVIMTGWPDNMQQCHKDIRQFYNFRECLGIEDGIIFKGRQIIIPKSAQGEILRQLHLSHQGIQKTQALARDSVYWPNINVDIEHLVRNCESCQTHQPKQQAEPTIHHEIPPIPWTKLGSDLFQVGNRHFLLIVDYFTKFPIVRELTNTSSAEVAKEFRYLCGILGRPSIIISDNGPQYTGASFKRFISEWDINHTTSSPHYPQSNGLAERTVGTVKHIIIKCIESKTDIDIALLHLRATPIDCKTSSPGELLHKRQIQTPLPTHLQPTTEDMCTRDHLSKRLQANKCTELPPLQRGQPIRVYNPELKSWQPGNVITPAKEPRSYVVRTEKGSTLRRNRSQLRETPLTESNQETLKPETKTNPEIIIPPATRQADTDIKSAKQEQPISPATTRTSSGRIVRMPKRYEDK